MCDRFPVMGCAELKDVPWCILKGHEQQAIKNHTQTVERLAERGGLDPVELASVLSDRDYYEYRNVNGKKLAYSLTLGTALLIIDKHIKAMEVSK